MKKILLLVFVAASVSLYALDSSDMYKWLGEARKKVSDVSVEQLRGKSVDLLEEIAGSTTVGEPVETSKNPTRRAVKGRRLKFPINERLLFSPSACDQVVIKKQYVTCYEYEAKLSSIVGYRVDGEALARNYIKDRPAFYPEKEIPGRYRAYPSDYTHTGYDRGHARSHASTAWDASALHETYSMVNIWPQAAVVNRDLWIKTEKYTRLIARKLGYVDVLNIADIGESPKRIGRNKVAVPEGFYKVLYNRDKNFERCFYYKNDKKARKDGDKMKAHVISCDKVYY